MKRTFMSMVAALAITLLPGVRVVAEEITFASHAEIMSVLERQNTRIAELEAALHNGGGCGSCNGGGCDSCGDSCCDSACDSCCDGCCDPCCRPGGIIGGAEVSFLKPHRSQGTRGAVFDMDFNYEAAPRIWAGYQGSDGLGVRLRYWEFNHEESITAGGIVDTQAYDTYVVDLEFVDSMSLGCYWDASIFGGFRYVEFDEERVARVSTVAVPFTGFQFDNSGYGLTIGSELRRCMGNGLAGYFNVRGSVIMADEDEYRIIGGQFVRIDEELDNVYFIWEAQSGVQWTNELQSGGYLFARAGFEVQIWDNYAGSANTTGGAPVADSTGTEDWGLGGVSFSAGIIR